MPIEDVSEFIQALEKAGELKRVKTLVDSDLEIAEILRRTMYENGPAVLFENVKNYDMPVLGNPYMDRLIQQMQLPVIVSEEPKQFLLQAVVPQQEKVSI